MPAIPVKATDSFTTLVLPGQVALQNTGDCECQLDAVHMLFTTRDDGHQTPIHCDGLPHMEVRSNSRGGSEDRMPE